MLQSAHKDYRRMHGAKMWNCPIDCVPGQYS